MPASQESVRQVVDALVEELGLEQATTVVQKLIGIPGNVSFTETLRRISQELNRRSLERKN